MAKPVMMTAKQASEYTGIDKNAIKNAWNNPKFASIFGGHMDELVIEGTDYKPVKRASQEAIDRWVAHRKTITAKRPSRANGRRYNTHIKDEHKDQVNAALAAIDPAYTLENPYEGHTKRVAKAKPAAQSTNGETTDVFEHELVEA